MRASGADRLHALLNEGGRELVDVKFFASPKAKDSERVLNAAADAIPALVSADTPDRPPVSGVERTNF
jgi:hypothetical protein